MAEEDTLVRHDHPRSGGTRDEPRIVKPEVPTRAGDRHRENLYALVIGVAVLAAIYAVLYYFQVV